MKSNKGRDKTAERVWHSPTGEVISCVEKIKVLREDIEEIRAICQDALEDAILMGCDEHQFRDELKRLMDELINPYEQGADAK